MIGKFCLSELAAEQAVVIRTFDDAAGVIAVESPEVSFGKVDFEPGIPGHRVSHIFDQLLIGIADQHT